jgi:hypothetical protein
MCSMMACRTCGRLGCGGGPLRLFPPPCEGEAPVLQERQGDQRHQRMAMQARPRAALEVVEAEFFLELLMRLLANPSMAAPSIRSPWDGRPQPAEGGP